MKPTLTFQRQELLIGDFGMQASVPAIMEMSNVQNASRFELDEDEEIFGGYEQITNCFPYREYSEYSRRVNKKETEVAILENDYLIATFLIEFGGRLWSLIDKATGTNLLYTNDVIRPSNLSIRNAWFSGGVEWNVGLIGHTPFTADHIFAASLETQDQEPVLRMYEYERIRKITYQMDFWLEENVRFLYCRMRVVNENDGITPMYWWSNMAVPEYEGGRIIVPAKKAYTHQEGYVRKVPIPMVNGIDISQYKKLKTSVDYFFDIPQDQNKYITNLNEKGYGLLQASTRRLKGRKLFSWGKKRGSNHWQEFLTEHAGRYIEIQAGLDKTQYGCFPMQPHTAIEWLEVYGAIQVEEQVLSDTYELACDKVSAVVNSQLSFDILEEKLKSTKQSLAKKAVKAKYQASGYGALENTYRKFKGKKLLSEHLDFGDCKKEQRQWLQLLYKNCFEQMREDEPPESYMADVQWMEILEASMEGINSYNWYACYQLGLMFLWKRDVERSLYYIERSFELKQNAWSLHALAVLKLMQGKKTAAGTFACAGIAMRNFDMPYVKECMKVLLQIEAYQSIVELYAELDQKVSENGRIKLYYIEALYKNGSAKEAYNMLMKDGGLEVADIREGERSLQSIWKLVAEENEETEEIPKIFDFSAND